MLKSPFLKKALPHIIAIAVFLVVAVVYCHPALQGKVVGQSDVEQYNAMAAQSEQYKEKHGQYPLWTESAFSGMPAYTIAIDGIPFGKYGMPIQLLNYGTYSPSNWLHWVPESIRWFFIACCCFYILMVVLRINPWIGVMASLAYAYCSYDPVILITGHVTKFEAIAYAPAVIASMLIIYRKKYLLGTALLAFFFATQIASQHLQMVYYTAICMGLLTLFYAIWNVREGRLKETAIAVVLAIFACVIGYGTTVGTTMPLSDYAKETMRGGRTELTNDANSRINKNVGMSRDYAFEWSYGIGETMTLVVPDMYGGGNGDRVGVGDNSKLVDKLAEMGVPEDNGIQIANSYAYWGPQLFTGGTVYIGAVICFLCIFSLVVLKGWQKWWLLSTIAVGILLAWGKHFELLNNFLFDHLPMYNKFRAPSQALVLPQLAAPILAALGLQHLLTGGEDTAALWKKFKAAAYISGVGLVLLIGFYFSAHYQGVNDSGIKERFIQQLSGGRQAGPDAQQQIQTTASSLMRALEQDRQSMAGSDLLRSIILIVLAAGLLGFFVRKKFNPVILLAGLLVLSTFDLLAVSNRYLTADSFQDPADIPSSLTPNAADQQIMADPDKNFRVLDESTGANPFESARASAFHNSVGGYSPAKLGLYDDLIYHQLAKGNMQVYDMLNTRYFIQPDRRNGQPVAVRRPTAYGPCWLVRGIRYVSNGDEEMKALDSADIRDTVIIQQQYAPRIAFQPVPDSTASIRLLQNDLDKIDYSFSAKTNQFVVFSEIYYDRGWDAYLDGKKTDYLRVNYVLRGMPVPAGQHSIEFRFEPQSYKTGMTLNNIFSILIIGLLIAACYVEWRKTKAQPPAAKA
ncbi:MAG TPA: YfhO family protein [Puia sp.]|jgi:hypothetical protein|nr:YfhO family protein [Puia sp.]